MPAAGIGRHLSGLAGREVAPMARVIAVFNEKGGVGKTTTLLTLAAGLDLMGRRQGRNWRILVVDADQQVNTTQMLTGRSDYGAEKSLTHLYRYNLYEAEQVTQAIVPSLWSDRIEVVPGDRSLQEVPIRQPILPRGDYRLADVIQEIAPGYDFVLFDTNPKWDSLSVAVFLASQYAIVPVDLRQFAIQGLSHMIGTLILKKREYRHPDFAIMGILITRFSEQLVGMRADLEALQGHGTLGPMLFAGLIPESIIVDYAQREGISLFGYAPKSKVAVAYAHFIGEVLGRLPLGDHEAVMGLPAPHEVERAGV
jgi:chromosome partitioning protein